MKKKKKNMSKEIVIVLLLLILISLILAVSLYDFVPSNINVPAKIEYSADSETTSIKQEIAYTNGGNLTADDKISDEESLVTSLKSYSIKSTDLTVYSDKKLYNSGNSNPFDYVEEYDSTITEENNSNTSDNGNDSNKETTTTTTSSSSGTSNSSSSTGTFFENKSSK